MQLTLVIPVYNEDESLVPLHQAIHQALGDNPEQSWEIVFVDDGSQDNSMQVLEGLASQDPEHTRVVALRRNYGQTAAIAAGIDHAIGEIIVLLDADLQNDPADIPRLIDKIQEGYDVVCGWRKARQDKPLKAFLSQLGNILQRALTGMRIHDVSCTLRAYRQECLKAVSLDWEGQHRFIPLSLSLQGYRAGEIIVHHRQRRFGCSKYSHKRIFKVIIDFFRVLIRRG